MNVVPPTLTARKGASPPSRGLQNQLPVVCRWGRHGRADRKADAENEAGIVVRVVPEPLGPSGCIADRFFLRVPS